MTEEEVEEVEEEKITEDCVSQDQVGAAPCCTLEPRNHKVGNDTSDTVPSSHREEVVEAGPDIVDESHREEQEEQEHGSRARV
jgi:hypothetical protein